MSRHAYVIADMDHPAATEQELMKLLIEATKADAGEDVMFQSLLEGLKYQKENIPADELAKINLGVFLVRVVKLDDTSEDLHEEMAEYA